ncbi:MAG: hypothetical protein ACOZCO_08055 [Bacteroidota bacterium]
MELSEEEFLLFNTRSKEQLVMKDGFLIHIYEDHRNIVALFALYCFLVEARTENGRSLQMKTVSTRSIPDEYLEKIMIEEFY